MNELKNAKHLHFIFVTVDVIPAAVFKHFLHCTA